MNQRNISIGILCLAIIFILLNFFHKNKEKNFWVWFSSNQDQIFLIKTGRESISDQITNHLEDIDQNLTWEISGSSADNKRNFVISAGGIKKSFPEVTNLVSAAPKELTRWNIIAFRQITDASEITYGSKTKNVSDLYFSTNKSGDKYDISIYVKGYEKGVDNNIVYLFLDSWLGEYNTEMKLGIVDIKALGSMDISALMPFKNIAQVIK